MKKNMKMDLWMQDLRQALRGLKHHGWQAGISAAGLVVGIVSLTFSLNWLWTETNYDYFRPGYKDIYMLKGSVTYRMAERLDSLSDGLVEVGILRPLPEGIRIQSDSLNDEVLCRALKASPGMVPVLGLQAVAGDPERALSVSGNVVITASVARRAFGHTDVVGKSFGEGAWARTVGAVVTDNVGQTAVEFDMLISTAELLDYERDWQAYRVFFRTDNPENAIKAFERGRYEEGKDAPDLMYIPLRMPKLSFGGSFLETYFYPLAFSGIALLLWLGGIVNLLAVYTSIFLGRTREYALRYSLGASGGQNVGWMYTAVFPVLLIGLLLSGMAMEWAIWWGDVPGNFSHAKVVFVAVAAASCVVVGAGMAYPVWKMRRTCRRMFEGRADSGHSHAWLLVVQCLVCAFLLFVSLGMQRQISGMVHTDLGFDCKDILRLHTYPQKNGFMVSNWDGTYYDFNGIFFDLPQEFVKEQGAGITDALAMPMDIFNRFTRLNVNVLTENEWAAGKVDEMTEQNRMAFVEIPYEAFGFFGIRMTEGKAVEHTDGGDRLSVVLNEAARKQFRVRDLREAHLHTGTQEKGYNYTLVSKNSCVTGKPLDVCGIAPVRLTDFHEEEGPLMLVAKPNRHKCRYEMRDAVYVKYAPGRREDAEAAVRRVLRKFDVQDKQIHLTTLEEYISDNYKEEADYANLLTALTVFSLLVTLSGVFSMLLYVLRLRRRSMAIRRVMGAEFRDIFLPQLRTYQLFVLAGCVVAYFPASLLMRKWMEYFHYGDVPGVGLMVLIWAGMSVLVLLIVWWQVRRCMREKPVEVLAPES